MYLKTNWSDPKIKPNLSLLFLLLLCPRQTIATLVDQIKITQDTVPIMCLVRNLLSEVPIMYLLCTQETVRIF